MSEVPRTRQAPQWVRIVVAILLVVALSGLTWFLTRPQEPTVAPPAPPAQPSLTELLPEAPSDTPTAAGSASEVGSSPAGSPTSTEPAVVTTSAEPEPSHEGLRAQCQPHTGDGFVPTRFAFERPSADEPVISLGLAADGTIAAPPPNQARTASWWNQGPQPGSAQGKVVLSIHTYRRGGALGNEMYEGGTSRMQPGDLVALFGPDGQVTCYEFTEARKIWVEEYDPDSDIMVDFDGDPMLAMIICWDFEPETEFWASRVFFYAAPWSP